ncbi:UNVERIFIED_CONTAM: hypothetical protein FKN15_038386 [Acipenser sinensis]
MSVQVERILPFPRGKQIIDQSKDPDDTDTDTDPDDSDLDPDDSDTDTDDSDSDTDPGDSDTDPDDSDTDPDDSDTDPDDSDSDPDDSDSDPDDSDTDPDDSDSDPDDSDTDPDDSDSDPDDSDTDPDDSDTDPGDSDTDPGDSDTDPGDSDMDPEMGYERAVVQATDTDIILLCIYFSSRMEYGSNMVGIQELWVQKKVSYIPTHLISKQLSSKFKISESALTGLLLSAYVFTGCDTVSYPFSKGKKQVAKLVLASCNDFTALANFGVAKWLIVCRCR